MEEYLQNNTKSHQNIPSEQSFSTRQFITKPRNKGRWSYEEHDLFINCLKKFGKDWDVLEQMIPTRSSIQIRSHCHKYLDQIKKDFQTEDPMECVLKGM